MDLFQKPEYLHRPDVTVETFLFTFFPNHEATMQQTLFQLGQMDIFFMTGFRSANNNTMSENLKEVFRNHARCGDNETKIYQIFGNNATSFLYLECNTI